MKQKLVIPIIVVVVSVIFVSVFSGYDESDNTGVLGGFSYDDSQIIQNSLKSSDILMSNPTPISDYTVKQYCMYFDEQNNQKIMNYCITTALTDTMGTPLGNLNMGGEKENPKMALALIESSPFLNTQKNTAAIVFETMIETLVCDCWKEQQPGGFESVTSWLDAAEAHFVDSGKESTKSKISGLANHQLVLEITKTGDSYLWTFIIIK